ncbi:Protein-tyrosine phosphatase containing protein [Aphelenchoides avenae]|nr:Protein-tyrosine phosphatase containing protein [Aphelenchus avenae]
MPPKVTAKKRMPNLQPKTPRPEPTFEETPSQLGRGPALVVAKCAPNARDETMKWIQRTLDKGVMALRMEFTELRRYVPQDMKTDAFLVHWEAGHNRYRDVPCQEKCRVVLRWPGQAHDYIHANYVATPISEKRFICTQGPMDTTIPDFWHMVLQEDVTNVIMLCNCVEKGMDKCAQYWPPNDKESQTYGDITVVNNGFGPLTDEEPTVRLTKLTLKWRGGGGKEESRDIKHFQWIDWPDRGVPPCKLTAMVLLSSVRGANKPIVVHCSAGIGRTGSIVAIEYVLERLQRGLPCEAMDEILKELRNQRPYSIQNDLQYLFVHRIILHYFIVKYRKGANNEDLQAKYRKFVEEYDKLTS